MEHELTRLINVVRSFVWSAAPDEGGQIEFPKPSAERHMPGASPEPGVGGSAKRRCCCERRGDDTRANVRALERHPPRLEAVQAAPGTRTALGG
jgi:hypothetical protein